jgi:seryl-tRNA synthetase
MTENFLLFIITTAISAILGAITMAISSTWKLAEFKNNIEDKFDNQINEVKSSLLELSAQVDLLRNSAGNDFKNTNRRITNLEQNATTAFKDLKHSQNELVNYLTDGVRTGKFDHKFIPRQRDKTTLSKGFEDESWTQEL